MAPHTKQLSRPPSAPVVTPSDTVDLPAGIADGLWIGGAGNLVFKDGRGTTRGPIAVPIGEFPFQVSRVLSTNTTATPILAIYRTRAG